MNFKRNSSPGLRNTRQKRFDEILIDPGAFPGVSRVFLNKAIYIDRHQIIKMPVFFVHKRLILGE